MYQIFDEKSLVLSKFLFTIKALEFSIYVVQNKKQIKCYLLVYTFYKLKKEKVNVGSYETFNQAKLVIFEFIESWYTKFSTSLVFDYMRGKSICNG